MGNATASLVVRWLGKHLPPFASSSAAGNSLPPPPSDASASDREVDAQKRPPPLTTKAPRPSLLPPAPTPLPILTVDTVRLLVSFDVDPIRGFLPPRDPLQRLPQPKLQEWERLAAALPTLLASGGGARAALDALPELPTDLLRTEEERRRALLLLSALASAYVWGEAAAPAKGNTKTNTDSAAEDAAAQAAKNDSATPKDTIPAAIAKPLCAVAAAVGVPPIMAHLSVVLANWRRLDPEGPIACGNLAPLVQFLGGPDEAAFYYVTVEIEARGGPAMVSLAEAQRYADAGAFAIANSRHDILAWATDGAAGCLAHVAGCVRGMREALMRLPELCDTEVFYRRVRPFLSGWRGNPTLPDGVLYVGVGGGRRRYYGGSAAQSSLAAALDAALGVSHDGYGSSNPGSGGGGGNGGRKGGTSAANRSEAHAGNCSNGSNHVNSHGNSTSNGADGVNNGGNRASGGGNGASNGNNEASKGSSGANGASNGTNEASKGSSGASNGASSGGSNSSSREFLLSMREYMPPGHRRFLEYLEDPARPSIRGFVSALDDAEEPEAVALRWAYSDCLAALDEFRTAHLTIVTRYVLLQQRRQAQERAAAAAGGGAEAYALDRAAGGKGTGGTGIMEFLKPLRDDVRRAALPA